MLLIHRGGGQVPLLGLPGPIVQGYRPTYHGLDQPWMVLGPVGEEFCLLSWLSECLPNPQIAIGTLADSLIDCLILIRQSIMLDSLIDCLILIRQSIMLYGNHII